MRKALKWIGSLLGGVLLLAAAVVALVWANSPWSAAYFSLRDVQVGPQALT